MSDRQRATSGSPYEGRYGFSRAVRDGSVVHVAGTAPIWPDGSCPDDVSVQARRCWQIVAEALAALGAGLDDVVRTRMYLTDPADADAVGAVHGEVFAQARPAATMVVVSGLLDPRWRVEVEATAVCGEIT